MKIDKHTMWMTISGTTGLLFLFIAHFTNFFAGSSFIAGVIQICCNVFVLITYSRAYDVKRGLAKLAAAGGIVSPPMMMTITTIKIIYPQVASWLS